MKIAEVSTRTHTSRWALEVAVVHSCRLKRACFVVVVAAVLTAAFVAVGLFALGDSVVATDLEGLKILAHLTIRQWEMVADLAEMAAEASSHVLRMSSHLFVACCSCWCCSCWLKVSRVLV